MSVDEIDRILALLQGPKDLVRVRLSAAEIRAVVSIARKIGPLFGVEIDVQAIEDRLREGVEIDRAAWRRQYF